MNLSFEIKYYFNLLFAQRLKVSKDDTTPILYDNYNPLEYYIVLNKNKANIYSQEEVDKFLDKKIDPMTRQKIKYYQIVKVKLI
jgi:hypothetical protein